MQFYIIKYVHKKLSFSYVYVINKIFGSRISCPKRFRINLIQAFQLDRDVKLEQSLIPFTVFLAISRITSHSTAVNRSIKNEI